MVGTSSPTVQNDWRRRRRGMRNTATVHKQQIGLLRELFPRCQQRRIIHEKRVKPDIRHGGGNTRHLYLDQFATDISNTIAARVTSPLFQPTSAPPQDKRWRIFVQPIRGKPMKRVLFVEARSDARSILTLAVILRRKSVHRSPQMRQHSLCGSHPDGCHVQG